MQTVACFGDSLIYGFPFGPRTSWLAEAEKVTGGKFLNYGVCGDCTDDILFRLQTMFLPAHIKHILFLRVDLSRVNSAKCSKLINCYLSLFINNKGLPIDTAAPSACRETRFIVQSWTGFLAYNSQIRIM